VFSYRLKDAILDGVTPMARGPGNVATVSIAGNGSWKWDHPPTGSSTAPRNDTIVIDYRPSYSKGGRGKIGSKVWIYPTGYVHKSRIVHAEGQAVTKQLVTGTLQTVTESNPPLNSMLSSRGYGLSADSLYLYPNLQNGAQVKALNDIADQKANIGEDLATYRQTIDLFRSKGLDLHFVLNAFKNDKSMRRFRKLSYQQVLASGSKRAAATYLEYVYGWKPLVSDLFGIYQLLKKYGDGSQPIIVHGHGSMSQSDTSYQAFGSAGWQTLREWWTRSTDIKVKARCDLWARIDPSLAPLRALNQLGLINPASLAWELVPWSFVVDWIFPIGGFLSAQTAPVGLTFISGSSSERVSRTHIGEWHNTISNNTTGLIEDTPIKYTVNDEFYVRKNLLTWPTPLPYINLTPLSGDRPFKALALLIANLKR
jgi:hypothetical protein